MKLYRMLLCVCLLALSVNVFSQAEDYATITVKATTRAVSITINGEFFDDLAAGKSLSFGATLGDKKRIVLEDNDGNKYMKEIKVSKEHEGKNILVQFAASAVSKPAIPEVQSLASPGPNTPAKKPATVPTPAPKTPSKTTTAISETTGAEEMAEARIKIQKVAAQLTEVLDKVAEGKMDRTNEALTSAYDELKGLLGEFQAATPAKGKSSATTAVELASIKKVIARYEGIRDGKRPSSNNIITAFQKSRAYDLSFWITPKNVADTNIDGSTTLFYALDNNCNADVISYLIKTAGYKDEYINYDKYTFQPPNKRFYMLPLTLACINGDTNVINALINAKARFCPAGLDEYRTKEQSKFLWQQFGGNKAVRALIKRRLPDFPDPFGVIENMIAGMTSDLVLIEGGSFRMGCEGSRFDCGRAWPAVDLTVPSFYLSKFEVTQRQWETIMEQNNSNKKDCPDCPVEQVTWDEVQTFIQKLNKLSGKNFRLPTEKEWEFAAKGGVKSQKLRYAGANNIDSVSWNKMNCTSLQPIGKKQPNELGIYDMSGNVFEWCSSYYSPTLEIYQRNPDGETSGSERVTKGGSWREDEFFSQPIRRSKAAADISSDDVGFRLALDK